ncbi:aspartate carbamoyltransferase catalytic subunit [Bacteriovoracales bacterium]|nr:aspartate carbamoyltransferase catalytic subunit [Bacteriovoracales bacterium]
MGIKSPEDELMEPFPLILESVKDLSKVQVQSVFKLAHRFKVGDFSSIQHKNSSQRPLVATFFQEPSTRTKNSFAIAAKRLNFEHVDLSPENSSLKKGEDLEQTFLTLKYQGVNLLVSRSPQERMIQDIKMPKMAYINGGDGKNQHPTQALLDVFTMIEKGLDLSKTTVAIIGDVLHSRVAHSLMDLIPQFGGKILLCGPDEWLPKGDLAPFIEKSNSLEDVILRSDVLYPLRIQKERHLKKGQVDHQFSDRYKISLKKLNQLKRSPLVFHAGPFNIGVEIDKDILESPLFQAYEQIENSVHLRMSLIQMMLESLRQS